MHGQKSKGFRAVSHQKNKEFPNDLGGQSKIAFGVYKEFSINFKCLANVDS